MNNWVLIGVLAVFLLCVIGGIVQGGIKIIVSLVASILTLVLVLMATPYVSQVLYQVTPIKSMVQKQCEKIFVENLKKETSSKEKQAIEESLGINLDDIDVNQKDIDWQKYGINEQDFWKAADRFPMPREAQLEAIDKAPIPEFIQTKLIENNNDEIYHRLGVNRFIDYVGAYFAHLITDMIAFLATFLVATLVVRIVIGMLDIISGLPILHGINRFLGGVLGLGKGLLIIWVFFVAVTLFYRIPLFGKCLDMIKENDFLVYLYDHNYILEWITKI